MKRIGIGVLSLLGLAFWSACSDEKPMTTTAPAATAAVLQADGRNDQNGNKGWADDDGSEPDESKVAFITRSNQGPDVAKETIGREGGRVRLNDFEIIVPRGAVDRPTVFSIRLKQVGNGRKRPAMAEFSPHQVFNVPVTIVLPWNDTDASNARVHVIWWDHKSWVPMASTLTRDGRVSAQTIHFSMFATCGLTVAGG